MSDDNTPKKEVIIKRYFYRDKDYIALYSKNGNLIKRYEYSEKANKLKSLSTTEKTNEKRIREYYQENDMKKGEIYTPTNTKSKEYNEHLTNFIDNGIIKENQTHEFKNENRLVFRKDKKIRQFDYMYINVEVKVYFDGHYTIARGRSDYVYGRMIEDREEFSYIRQAIKRAIAPYGSNLKFKLLNWNYAYHQEKYIHFGKKLQ